MIADCQLSIVPQGRKTDEEAAASRQLTIDVFSVACLFERMEPTSRREIIDLLSRMTDVEHFP